MKKLINKLRKKIWLCKFYSRFDRWQRIRDRYDCGYSMARYISFSLCIAERRLNEAIDMCNKLDPNSRIPRIGDPDNEATN